MDRIVIHQSEKMTVWCYPKEHIVHHQMHGYCYGEPFRAGLSAGVDALVKHAATKWLSDDRSNGALSPDDEEWATKTWFPRTKAGGWKLWAMVQPEKVVGQMNVARFVKLYGDLGITARIFTEVPPALEWLLKET